MSGGALDPVILAEERQRRASRPEVSVWVAASAGTGKTKVLTDRVLRLLLNGVAPPRILCLTFTKAAAAEMADRVNRRLAAWAVIGEAELVADLTDLTGDTPAGDAVENARRLFAEVIDAPGGIVIETIHAFCQSVLKRFPVEAGIAPHFEVLDDRTAWEMLHEAKEEVIAECYDGDSDMTEALALITERVHETRFDDLILALKSERGRLRAMGKVDTAAAEKLVQRLGGQPNRDDTEILRAACRAEAFDGSALAAAARALQAGSPTDRDRGATIVEWLDAGDGRVELFQKYRRVFLTAKGTALKRLATKDALAADPKVEGILATEAARLMAVDFACRVQAVALASAALVRLGGAIVARYGELKSARAAMDYDDLILAVRDLLERAGGVSWVMYKLDEGIDHILIDEAQDTNPEQWQIVRALAGDFFAGAARETGAVPRTVFAVGDAKQSIFGFQRADPAGFAEARVHFAATVAAAGQRWDTVDLNISFRSTAAVLQAVDAVFATAAARDGVVEKGDIVSHQAKRIGHGGIVELWPAPVPSEDDAIEPWALPTERPGSPVPEHQVARLIAARIDDWIRSGEWLDSRGRAVRPGDFMILVRRRRKFVLDVVRELKQRNIPVAGVDRMVLTDQIAVMDLIALGDFLLMPGDDLTLAVVLRGPLIGMDEDRLFALAGDRGGDSLWRRLRARRGDDPIFARAHAHLSALLARADFVPPYELYAELLGAGGGRSRLLARLGPEAADPIEEFLGLALAYERSHVPSLQGFLAWVRGGRAEIKRDLEHGGHDQVRVMTVHGAKGLQAPIVILPDTLQVPADHGPRVYWDEATPVWPPKADDDTVLTARLRAQQVEALQREYRRLLYVAMTRAEDRLYVVGWHNKQSARPGNWYDLIANALAPIAEEAPFDAGRWLDQGWTGKTLRLAHPQTADPEVEKPAADTPASLAPPDWLSSPPQPEAAPPRPLTPSRPGTEDPATISPLGQDSGARFHRGLIIHRLLQILPEMPAERRAAACRAWLARSALDLDAAARDALAAEVLAVLDTAGLDALFGPGSRAEVPVAGVVGDRAVAGQIDRLVVAGDRVLVVDYKTNRAPPVRPGDTPPAYIAQMAAYRAVLKNIYPRKSICCALLWTDGPVMMRLPDGLLDNYAP